MAQCTATSKTTGKRCKQPAINGTTKCYYHGGASLRGPDHPNFQDKGRSKYMPDALAEKFERSKNDPDLVDLREDIALQEALILEQLEGLAAGGNPEAIWEDLNVAIAALSHSLATDDQTGAWDALHTLQDITAEQQRGALARRELRQSMDGKRRLVETQARMESNLDTVITIHRFMAVMGLLAQAVNEIVSSATERYELANRIREVISIPAPEHSVRAGEPSSED